jgi:hypothetical protein
VYAAYRATFRELGPRHKALDRWKHELGWHVSLQFANSWLEPERKKRRKPFE